MPKAKAASVPGDQSLGRKAEKHIRVGERAIQPTSTDSPCQGRGTQGVKETAVYGVTLIDAVVAAVRVGQDRLRPVCYYRLLRLCRHRGDCLVPGEALEARSWSLWAHALDRIKEAVWCVHPVKELVDLGTQRATGERMLLVGGDFHCFAVIDGHIHQARVRTVVWAGDLSNMGHNSLLTALASTPKAVNRQYSAYSSLWHIAYSIWLMAYSRNSMPIWQDATA